MEKISTLLVPYDFSESAERALDYAVAFVGRNDDMTIILARISGHRELDLPPEDYQDVVEKYRSELKNELEWITREGGLTEALLDIQGNKQIDLIVMGTGGSKDKATGTNTSKLALEADCPVMVVPQGYSGFRVKRIALVLGKKEIDDAQVLGTLLDVARRFNAVVHVLTIKNTPGIYGYSEADRKNESTIRYYLEHFFTQHSFIENTDIVAGIMDYAQNNLIDMIGILPRNHAQRSAPSEGELTKELSLRSKIPILAMD
ncbi:universal stress protein [Pricia sp. S334]|uniref:Universal stress protein n=1 Tax=Pricia mediterranea TaxID=3076079 RepID=A0ABU3L135_9FLAO|nr:universal stress protein [Pricia sp. S334]MDT7827411.1 universal stress protein [Pricia sp. S334]